MPKAMQRVTPAASPFLSVRHVPRQDSKNGRVAGIAWNPASMRPNGRGTENESPDFTEPLHGFDAERLAEKIRDRLYCIIGFFVLLCILRENCAKTPENPAAGSYPSAEGGWRDYIGTHRARYCGPGTGGKDRPGGSGRIYPAIYGFYPV